MRWHQPTYVSYFAIHASSVAAEGHVDGLPWRRCFRRVGQDKWRFVLQALVRMTRPDDLRTACLAWHTMLHRDYLSLANMAAALPFLRWLAACGIRSTQLVVSTQFGRDEPQLDAVVETIEGLFGGRPCLRAESARRGRPMLYLMVSSHERHEPGNAALSVAGLHALMFSAWVWTRLCEDA